LAFGFNDAVWRRRTATMRATIFKTSILNLKVYRTYLGSSFRWYWPLALVILPAASFTVLNIFRTEIAAILSTLHPASAGQGSYFFIDLVDLAASEILWIGFFFLMAFLLMAYCKSSALENIFDRTSKIRSSHLAFFLCTAFFVITVCTSTSTLDRFANSSDEYSYLLEARLMSKGRIWQVAHDLPDFFYQNNVVQNDGILLSPFRPGWSMILSAAFEIAISPAWVNPILGLLALILFYLFARHLYGERVAVWSLAGVALTGFYVFNAASFFPHITNFLLTLLLVSCLHLHRETGRWGYAVIAGFLLGFLAIIEYYTVFMILIPFAIYLVYQYRLKSLGLIAFMGLGALPFVVFLMSYNYAITGDAFVSVKAWSYPLSTFGFVKGHNVLKGGEHLVRWILLFFYWCSPGFLILYFVFLYRKLKARSEAFANAEDYLLLVLMLGYFFYYQVGGNQYGPRFLFEGFPFLVLFVTRKVLQSREKWAMAFLVASVVFAVIKFPFISSREKRIVEERQDLYDLVREEHLSNAVVFVTSPTSPTRPMPVDDLTRNDPKFENDVIYALELPKASNELMKYYSDRLFYRYTRDLNERHGELTRIR
jgi:hypothetical protein